MNQQIPLVTTIIPTYRRPHLLARAIKSALAQIDVPLKVCVYDNASGDETRDVVDTLAAQDNRLKYVCHAANIGAFANFQYGLKQIQTPFFSLLSDDDVLLPGFYKAAMDGFKEFPGAMMWAGVTVRMDPAGKVYDARVERWPREGLYSGLEGVIRMTGGMAPFWTGAVIRRSVLESVGYLDEDVGAPSDLDWTLRIAARHPFVVSKRPVAIFVIHPQSTSETGPLSAVWPGWLKMIANVKSRNVLNPEECEQVQSLLHADARRMLFRRALGALSKVDYLYVKAAADILDAQYGRKLHCYALRLLTGLCSNIPSAQKLYTAIYMGAVRVALNARTDLRRRYGGLVQYLNR